MLEAEEEPFAEPCELPFEDFELFEEFEVTLDEPDFLEESVEFLLEALEPFEAFWLELPPDDLELPDELFEEEPFEDFEPLEAFFEDEELEELCDPDPLDELLDDELPEELCDDPLEEFDEPWDDEPLEELCEEPIDEDPFEELWEPPLEELCEPPPPPPKALLPFDLFPLGGPANESWAISPHDKIKQKPIREHVPIVRRTFVAVLNSL